MQDPFAKKGRIDSLSDKLYSRGAPSVINETKDVLPEHSVPEVNSNWNEKDRLTELVGQAPPPNKHSFLKIFFFISLIFFIISAGVALFAIFGNFNSISSKNVDISVLGPTSIGGGEHLTLEIIVDNKNNIALETADLLVEYPQGTRTVTDLQKELLRSRESLGRIESGDNVRRTVQAVLFGEKDSIQTINVSVEYRVKGSNATFSKEKKYEIVMASSPITLTATYPKEIASNKEFEVTLQATSNSTEVIQNALVRAEYPFGYTFTRSTPKQISGDNMWRLGDLKPGEKRTIKITGQLEGQDNEQRTFRFSTGIASDKDENILATEFVTLLETVAIRKPGLGIDLVFGTSNSDTVVTAGSRVNTTVRWTNNLAVPIVNGRIEARLSGSALDRASVIASKGFYRSVDNTVLWDYNSNPELANIVPGARGEYTFSFNTLGQGGGLPLSNQSIEVEAVAFGSQVSGGTVPEELSSSVRRKISIASDIGLNTRIVYSIGPFANKGPIPPRAERETTYTVIWTATNSSNDISGAIMKATIPSYVTWLSTSVPANENISFDPISRTITWNIGELRAGTGFSSVAREVSFQISFLPSLSQVETSPDLVGVTTITGKDKFTNAFLDDSKASLTTRLGTDPLFKNGDERVKP